MNDTKQKIKKIFSKIPEYALSMLGGAPHRYWILFLVLFFILLTGIFMLDGFIFQHITSSAFRDIYVLPDTKPESINKNILSDIIEIIRTNEESFSEIFSEPSVPDPS